MVCLIFNRYWKTCFWVCFCSSFVLFLLYFVKNSMDRVSVICKLAMKWYLMRMCASWLCPNLVPRAHVPFGQHQDRELWNNQFPETKILGLPASRRMRDLVYMASRDKVDVDTFYKGIQYALERLGKSKFVFESTTVSNFKSKSHEGSGNELVDYSRAPCLGADQKARGLWERDWLCPFNFSFSKWCSCWACLLPCVRCFILHSL